MLALHRAVRLHFNRAQLIIGILEEQTPRSFARAKINRSAHSGGKDQLGSQNQRTAGVLLRRFARAHLHIKQMLLTPLPPT